MLDYVPRYGNENIPYDDSSKILFFYEHSSLYLFCFVFLVPELQQE